MESNGEISGLSGGSLRTFHRHLFSRWSVFLARCGIALYKHYLYVLYPSVQLPHVLFMTCLCFSNVLQYHKKNCITGLCADVEESIMLQIDQNIFPQLRKQKRRCSLLLYILKNTTSSNSEHIHPHQLNTTSLQ